MGQRIMRVDLDLLRQSLKLPDGVEIVAAKDDFSTCRGDLLLKIESPDFSEVQSGCRIPLITAEFTAQPMHGFHTEVTFTGWYPKGDAPIEIKKPFTLSDLPGWDSPIYKNMEK